MPLAIHAKKLTRQFGLRKAVNNVSFSLPKGAFLTVFGPNGAGKTTLLRMLATLSRPTSGELLIYDANALEQPDAIRSKLGMISHQSMLYPNLTAEENLIFFAHLYGIKNPQERAEELLDAVGLKHRRHDCVGTFSRGMLQRTSIARALIHDPEIVLLDEPYAGLDPHAAEVFDTLLEKVRQGRTFVMVSHDFDKGMQLATHALLLSQGKGVALFEKDTANVQSAKMQNDSDCTPSPINSATDFKQIYLETVGGGVV